MRVIPASPDIRTWLTAPPVALLLAVLCGLAAGLAPVFLPPLAVLALAPALAAVAVMLARPRLGLLVFVALVTLLPWVVVPLRFGVQFTALDVVLVCLLIGWLVGALQRGDHLEGAAAGTALVTFCGLAVASFLLSVPYAFTPELLRRFLKLLNSLLFFYVVLNLVRDLHALERQLRALLLCGGLAALIGLVVYVQPPEQQISWLSQLSGLGYPSGRDVLHRLPGPNDTYTDILRATGTAIEPNVFAGMLMVVAMLAIAQFFAPAPLLPRGWLVGLGLVTVACLILTHSRATWLGLAAGLAWLATLKYRRAWFLAALAAVLLVYTPVGQDVLARVASGFVAQDKAAALRLSEFRNAFEIIQAYPLLGIGFGAAPRLDLHPAVSSTYLLVAEQVGLLGLGAFLAAVAAVMVPSLRATRATANPDSSPVNQVVPPLQDERRLQGVLAALQSAFVAALVVGLFDHYWANLKSPHAVALFWYLGALLVRAARVRSGY